MDKGKLFQNFIFIVLAVVMVINMAPFVEATFLEKDITKTIEKHWAKEYINYALDLGVFGENIVDGFNPDIPITRGEFVAVLGRMGKIDTSSYKINDFIDVAEDSYYSPYIQWAYDNGIINGIGRNLFAPDRTITREEASTILQRYTRANGYVLPVIHEYVEYEDALEIYDVFKDDVKIIQQAGIMIGKSNNRFDPKANITYGEVSVLVNRYDKIKENLRVWKTGWVKDDNGLRYYNENIMLIGWNDIGALEDKKTYYFKQDGIMEYGGWKDIEGKKYYFNNDGSIAKNTTIGIYQVDKNGIRKEILEDTSNNYIPDYDYPAEEPEIDEKEFYYDKDENVVVVDENSEFINLNDPFDDEPPLEGKRINYLLYGYNVLKYGYINSQYIDFKYPIFDEKTVVEKTDEDGEKEDDMVNRAYYIVAEDTASDIKYLCTTSIKSLYEDFDISSSAKYKGLFFSGELKGEYKLSKSMTEEDMLIKYIQYHRTENQAFTVGVNVLKENLSQGFRDDVAMYALTSPKEIFKRYGTHAITQYYLGGRAEMNYHFTNSTRSSEQEIRASVEAAYKGFSGKVDATSGEKSKLILGSNTTSFSSIGGKNISGTDPDDISKKYDIWVSSLEDRPVLCGIANIDQSLVPVWELIDDAASSKSVEEAFIEEAKTTETDLSVFESLPVYITDIVVCSGKDSETTSAQIPTGYTKVYLNPGTNGSQALEANKGAGGNYIYIGYKLSTDKAKAITNIQIISGKKSNIECASGYTKIPVDLNEGAGGNYIYLCYKRSTVEERNDPETYYLKEIRGVYGKSYTQPAYWEWPAGSVNHDLNQNCPKKGNEYIRLFVRRGF